MAMTSSSLSSSMLFWIVLTVILLWNAAFLFGTDFLQLPPYMDEIFHIPQAQVICMHDFVTWDHKITTFPGLYYLSYLVLLLWNTAMSWWWTITCDERMLRLVNMTMSIGIFVLVYRIRRNYVTQQQGQALAKDDSVIVAILAYLYPFNFLYYYLYYTDTASLFFYLVTHYLVQSFYCKTIEIKDKKIIVISIWQHFMLFLSASTCIFMRQTNVIWILFLLGTTMLHVLTTSQRDFADSKTWSLSSLITFVVKLWQEKVGLIILTWSMILPIIAFVGFVIWNKGIVLGDKENHQPSIHFAMLPHAMVLYVIMASPRILCNVWDHIQDTKQDKESFFTAAFRALWNIVLASPGKVFFCIVVLIATSLALVYGSLSHPFLLADNRHYIFYLWNRILKHMHYRMILAPAYSLFVLIGILDLSQTHGFIWMLIFLIAIALSLLPTPLLEPRYFTQTVITALLQSPSYFSDAQKSKLRSALFTLQVVALVSFNFIVVFIYFMKPFTWHDGSVARFIY